MEVRDTDAPLTESKEVIQRAPVLESAVTATNPSNLQLLQTAFLHPRILIPSPSIRKSRRVAKAIRRQSARQPYRHAQDAIGCSRKELSREQRRQSNRQLPMMATKISCRYQINVLRPGATDSATVQTPDF